MTVVGTPLGRVVVKTTWEVIKLCVDEAELELEVEVEPIFELKLEIEPELEAIGFVEDAIALLDTGADEASEVRELEKPEEEEEDAGAEDREGEEEEVVVEPEVELTTPWLKRHGKFAQREVVEFEKGPVAVEFRQEEDGTGEGTAV